MYTVMATWMLHFSLAVALLFALRLLLPLIKKEHSIRRLTTDEYLSKMARICDCSVYDLFRLAAGQWQVTRPQVDEDFKAYITEEAIPYYVNDLIRRHKRSLDETKDVPLFLPFN